MTEPIIKDIIYKTKTNIEFELQYHAKMDDFDGHFPNFPILPGVSQIDLAIKLSNKYFKENRKFKGIKKLKFKEPITSNLIVYLNLEILTKINLLKFNYFSDSFAFSSGDILFYE